MAGLQEPARHISDASLPGIPAVTQVDQACMFFQFRESACSVTVIIHDGMKINLTRKLSLAHAVYFALTQKLLCFFEATLLIQVFPADGDRYFGFHTFIY